MERLVRVRQQVRPGPAAEAALRREAAEERRQGLPGDRGVGPLPELRGLSPPGPALPGPRWVSCVCASVSECVGGGMLERLVCGSMGWRLGMRGTPGSLLLFFGSRSDSLGSGE